MIQLAPISESCYSQLKDNYFAVAVNGLKESSEVDESVLAEFVEQQLTTILEQSRQDKNTFFHSIVLKGVFGIVCTLILIFLIWL